MDHLQHYANLKYNIERLRDLYSWLRRDFGYLEEDMALFYGIEKTEAITRDFDLVRDFNGVFNVWYEQDHYWGENDNFVNGGARAVVYSKGLRTIPSSVYPVVKFHPMSAFKRWRTPQIKIIELPIRTFFLDRLYNH
jgi:hypothetical protein